jgi:hypothetical protein
VNALGIGGCLRGPAVREDGLASRGSRRLLPASREGGGYQRATATAATAYLWRRGPAYWTSHGAARPTWVSHGVPQADWGPHGQP